MKSLERLILRLDKAQQRHTATAFLFGVIKKYADDRGSTLAALVAYYSFIALFPALLATFTVAGFLLPHFPQLEHRAARSVLRQFPVIGPQLQSSIPHNVHPLRGNVFALVVGLLGLLWGCLGVTQSTQHAMNDVWDVPRKNRPDYISRLLRGLLLLALFGAGVLVSVAISDLGDLVNVGFIGDAFIFVLACAVDTLVALAIVRVMTAPEIKSSMLWTQAALAGVGFELIQTAGVSLIRHDLRHASNVYGTFGLVLGLVFVLYLFSQLLVWSAEINAVYVKRLWPRTLALPSLTDADRRALVSLSRRELRHPDQRLEVDFQDDQRVQRDSELR
jgi:YihY family inner membrane protein